MSASKSRGPVGADAIEVSLTLPGAVLDAATQRAVDQDAERGAWVSPRAADQPFAPWPSTDNPILRYLLLKAEASIAAGMDPRTALAQLAVHAWFEGGIENYDRARRETL